MLWIIQYPSIQILFIFWIVQLLYAGYATTTIKVNDFIKSLIIISLFIITYYTVELSKNWLGTPSFTDDEVVGTLDGYDKFIVNGKEMFSIMVTTKTGPFMFVMPYSPQIEKDLSESMAKKSTEGKPTVVRKRSAKQLELDKENRGKESQKLGKSNGSKDSVFEGGEMEFYDFTDQMLVPKHADPIEK